MPSCWSFPSAWKNNVSVFAKLVAAVFRGNFGVVTMSSTSKTHAIFLELQLLFFIKQRSATVVCIVNCLLANMQHFAAVLREVVIIGRVFPGLLLDATNSERVTFSIHVPCT